MTERLHFHFSLSCIGEGNGNPLQCSCLENPRDGGAWWAAVYGVAQSRTQLKQLSSSSSSSEQRDFITVSWKILQVGGRLEETEMQGKERRQFVPQLSHSKDAILVEPCQEDSWKGEEISALSRKLRQEICRRLTYLDYMVASSPACISHFLIQSETHTGT